MRVVIAGNPGAGKSTLLNTLIGRPIFPSGISIGSGLTQETATHTAHGFDFVDTPGLADLDTRHRAASQISKALSSATELKLIFVCTLESGAVRSGDLAAIDTILGALEDAGANVVSRFSVIVNKCDDAELRQIGESPTKQRLLNIFSRQRGTPKILFLPLVRHAMGANDFLLTTPDICWDFVYLAPEIIMPPDAIVQINVEDYDAERDRLEGQLLVLRRRYDEELKKKKALERTKAIVRNVARGIGFLMMCGLLGRFLKLWYQKTLRLREGSLQDLIDPVQPLE